MGVCTRACVYAHVLVNVLIWGYVYMRACVTMRVLYVCMGVHVSLCECCMCVWTCMCHYASVVCMDVHVSLCECCMCVWACICHYVSVVCVYGRAFIRLVNFLCIILLVASARHIDIAFKMFDLNGDGEVSLEEFKKVTPHGIFNQSTP